jgi:hypothetical protein
MDRDDFGDFIHFETEKLPPDGHDKKPSVPVMICTWKVEPFPQVYDRDDRTPQIQHPFYEGGRLGETGKLLRPDYLLDPHDVSRIEIIPKAETGNLNFMSIRTH